MNSAFAKVSNLKVNRASKIEFELVKKQAKIQGAIKLFFGKF